MSRSRHLPRWLAAAVPVLLVSAPAFADSKPLPAPAPLAADCAPCAAPSPCPPKVIVHQQPPEVVYEDGGCGRGWFRSRCGLFGHGGGLCEHCAGKAKGQTQVTMTPLAMTTTLNSVSLVGGTSNLAGGLQLLTGTANLSLTQQTGGSDFAGLRAVHEAEIRAAGLTAVRAQQDAELRSTVAALERARTSLSAALASGNTTADASANTAQLNAAANTLTANTAALNQISQYLTRIEARLTAVERDVQALRKSPKPDGGNEMVPPRVVPSKPEEKKGE